MTGQHATKQGNDKHRAAQQIPSLRPPTPQLAAPFASILELQRQAGNRATSVWLQGLANQSRSADSSTVSHGTSTGGQPLDSSTRTFMESRFGRDFGDVQIHTGPAATESAAALHAKAYTVDNKIVFGEGRYAPDTFEGKRLLAHELTHVVQQSQSADVPHASPQQGESEARQASSQVLQGQSATVATSAPMAVQRDSAEPQTLEEMEAFHFSASNPHARENLTKTIEAMGGPCLVPTRFSHEELMTHYWELKNRKMGSKIPNVEDTAPKLGPEPYPGRSRHTIIVRGADFTGLDPLVKERYDVWATDEEALQIESGANSQFHRRALTAAMGGVAQMGASRASNQAIAMAPTDRRPFTVPTPGRPALKSIQGGGQGSGPPRGDLRDVSKPSAPRFGPLRAANDNAVPPSEPNSLVLKATGTDSAVAATTVVVPPSKSGTARVANAVPSRTPAISANNPNNVVPRRIPSQPDPAPDPIHVPEPVEKLPPRTDAITTSPTGKQRMSTATRTEVIRRAYKADTGEDAPRDHDLHHIVEEKGGGKLGDEARRLLDEGGIGYHEGANLVPLPNKRGGGLSRSTTDAAVSHEEMHTDRYLESIIDVLKKTPKTERRGALREIRRKILNDEIPHQAKQK